MQKLFVNWLMVTITVVFSLHQSALAESGVESIQIKNGWIRAALPVQKTSAAYLTLINQSDEPMTLTEVKSSIANHTMIHKTVEEQGIAKMRHQDSLLIEPGQSLEFKPGGLHVMLMGLNHPVTEGMMATLVLHFDNGSTKTVKVPVKTSR